jgi:hypothetical protein
MKNPATVAKRDQHNLNKYGVRHAAQSDEVQEKIKLAWQKYTNGHPLADPVVRDKQTNPLMQKYGVMHPILSPEIQQKDQTHLYATIR